MRALFLFFSCTVTVCSAQIQTELATRPVENSPGYIPARSYNVGDLIYLSANPALGSLDGQTLPVYVCEDKNALEWTNSPELVDARSGGTPQFNDFSGATYSELSFALTGMETLESQTGDRPGHGYDLVIDVDGNGVLSGPDWIDGYQEAGFYRVGNMNELGLHDVDSTYYSAGQFKTFTVWWPSDIDALESQPLVVFSHGWTHEYWYYHSYAEFLASYGYVVMCHRNDVGQGNPAGTESAAQSALESMDELLSHLATIAGGVLNGKIDAHRIIHTGHSTGGECVVRAYKRLFNGSYVSPNFDDHDIVLVSSIAPVAWFNSSLVNPESVNYHVFLGGADTDASGEPTNAYSVPASIYERGTGNRQLTYIHGAGHEDFHDFDSVDQWPDALASGPNLIGKEATHSVVRPYFLALCDLYSRNNQAMSDFITRNHTEFRPLGIDPGITISSEYIPHLAADDIVLDDFQTNEEISLSSLGLSVTTNLAEMHEVEMRDDDGSFNWSGNQWSNGMVRARFNDGPRCAALAWNGDAQLEYSLDAGLSDWTDVGLLTFRTCQLTRHPLNYELNGDISFDVTLHDGNGASAALNTMVCGPIHPPYERGNGGYAEFCLEEGEYTVTLDGSVFNSEISFEIPGFLSGGSGNFLLEIPASDSCTTIEVLCYDGYGDGWDTGILTISDSLDNVVGTVDLYGGSEPDFGYGWQNEFYSFQFRPQDFALVNPELDLSQVTSLSFDFGPSHGSSVGAIGLDDIAIRNATLLSGIDAPAAPAGTNLLSVFPNPASSEVHLVNHVGGANNWRYFVHDLSGKCVLAAEVRGTQTVIDVAGIAAGVYTITAITGDTRQYRQLMIR